MWYGIVKVVIAGRFGNQRVLCLKIKKCPNMHKYNADLQSSKHQRKILWKECCCVHKLEANQMIISLCRRTNV